jgi:hypothetical protein
MISVTSPLWLSHLIKPKIKPTLEWPDGDDGGLWRSWRREAQRRGRWVIAATMGRGVGWRGSPAWCCETDVELVVALQYNVHGRTKIKQKNHVVPFYWKIRHEQSWMTVAEVSSDTHAIFRLWERPFTNWIVISLSKGRKRNNCQTRNSDTVDCKVNVNYTWATTVSTFAGSQRNGNT